MPLRPAVLAAALSLLAVAAGTAVAVLPTTHPASAELRAATDVAVTEAYDRPADGVFLVDGHGWGHGRGLSQYGAQGAATLGLSADTITSTYYPGTARTVLPPSVVRVLLSGDEGRDTDVVAVPGLVATDLATGAWVALPAGPARWRVVGDAYGLHLQRLDGAAWTTVALGGQTSLAGPVSFGAPGLVRLRYPDGSARDYRGTVRAVRTGTTSVASVDVLDLEDYLLGVVPREAVPSWLPAALQAQAIAARSYAVYGRDHAAAGAYDVCDTTSCQVFGGTRLVSASGAVTELEQPSTTAAVRATASVVRTYAGRAVLAEFGSSNGGFSVAGGAPYLPARQDDWDGVVPTSVHTWSAVLRVADLEARFPALGHLDRLVVTARDGGGEWGGRVRAVTLEGTAPDGTPTRVRTDGAGVYGASTWPGRSDGLRSTWWHLRDVPPASVVGRPGGRAVLHVR